MALYTDDTIHRIVDDVNKKYFLPDIQRPFVWSSDQIYTLFDSIMRGYPISTFLFWLVSKEYLQENNIKKFKFISNNKESNSEDLALSNSEYFLVLDGQQRITALNIALKGSYFERRREMELFFNALSGTEEDEDGLLYEFKFLDRSKPLVFQDAEKLWVKTKMIYDCESPEKRMDLIDEILKVNNNERKIRKNIEVLHSRLRGQEILNYYIEREKDYDKVLDIFVRTNSGGTKLTYSDLLFSTIKLRWKDARKNFSDLLKEINGDRFDFDTDFVLKTCFVIFAQSQKDVKYSRKNVDDKEKIENIIRDWIKITESIKNARDLLNIFGISHRKLLSSNNALIPIVYFVYKKELKGIGDSNQSGVITPENQKLMKNFLFTSLLTGLFGGQADTILYAVKQEIDSSNGSLFPINEIKRSMSKRNKSMDITEEFLDNVYYQDKNSYLVLNLMYPGTNLAPNSRSNLQEQDHIFSQDELEKEKFSEEEINTIFNLRYATSIGNKKKTNISFLDWVRDLTPQEKEANLIPNGTWGVESYKDFLIARKRLILSKIRETF